MKFLKSTAVALLITAATIPAPLFGDEPSAPSEETLPPPRRVAIGTNLLYDALLTPNAGVEAVLTERWSLYAGIAFAWWGRTASNRVWRLWDVSAEARRWLEPTGGALPRGHHLDAYVSVSSYDFQFGNRGWQSPGAILGVGVGYGYGFILSERLTLDCRLRLGYSGGRRIRYHVVCGQRESYRRGWSNYWGPTALSVSLCWWPRLQ